VTFDLELDLEHILDEDTSGDHCVQVWRRSGDLHRRRSDFDRPDRQSERRTDGRRTMVYSSFSGM